MQGRDFRSFIIQVVCCLMLLHGPPLMALEHGEVKGWSEPEWLADFPLLQQWTSREFNGSQWLARVLPVRPDMRKGASLPALLREKATTLPVTVADQWTVYSRAAGSGASGSKARALPVKLCGRKARSEAYSERESAARRSRFEPRAASVVTKTATSPEIAALAAELDHIPARLLTFVHDTIDLDRRWGAYRSPLQTLREGRGTTWDQAGLLQALLAAGGVDARFVWGEIEISPAVLKAVGGVEDPWRAGDLLTTAGVPIVLLTEGNEVVAARMQHVWLEAWIDYSPNRGATVGPGDHWMIMDPSLKPFERSAGQSLDVPFALDVFLESGTDLSPRQTHEAALAAPLADLGLTLDQVKPTSTIREANFPFVPGVLAAKTLSIAGEAAEVPEAFQEQLTFEMRDGNGRELLTYSATASELSGRRLEIAWPGATAADVAALELYGSVFAAPPFEVDLKPVLWLDSVDVVTGEAIGSAEDVTLQVTLTAPGRGTIVVPFELLAGEPAAFLAEQPTQGMIDASDGLVRAVALYSDRLRADLDHLAGLRGQILLPLDIVALAMERGARSVSPDGTPLTFSPGPRTVDLGAMTVGLFPADGVWPSAEDSRGTLELLGAQSSHLEGEAIVEVFGGEPLNAVGLLTRAARKGQSILRADSGNVGTVLGQVALGEDAEAAVRAGVSQGRIAWVHEEQLPFETWLTSAYVLEDPDTGAAGFFVTFERIVEAIDGRVEFHAPVDLDVITAPTNVVATIDSEQLASWTLAYRPVGEALSTVIATGSGPVQNTTLGQFDPTLLLNGLYEIVLTGTDAAGQQLVGKIAVSVEGNMKIGHFTLSFVDLAIPLSGLDIEVVRTYDSRQRQLQGDFGQGWTLDIRQGSYRNNRPPGDGWQFQTGFLPCDSIIETKSHVTTVRLSDQEVYRFRLRLGNGAPTQGGCFAEAGFEYVDGPLPGSTLEIVGNASVFYENGGDRVIDAEKLEVFVPEDVVLTTRDGRIFELDLEDGVTRLEDLNGNELVITPADITHSSGRGADFERDGEGRIVRILDPAGHAIVYDYDQEGDLIRHTDQGGAETRFTYRNHFLEDIQNALGVRAVRTEYDGDGRAIKMTDAFGKEVLLSHDLGARREVVTNRLGAIRILEYDERGNVIREIDELGKVTARTFDGKDRLLTETNPLGNAIKNVYDSAGNLISVTDPLGNVMRFTHDDLGNPTTVTDPRGKVAAFSYDSRGNLTSATDPLGAVTSFTYDERGHLLTQTDAAGHLTQFAYDDFGNRIRITDAIGVGTVVTHDLNGNITSQTTSRTLPDGSTESLETAFSVDELGRVFAATLPDGSAFSVTYDPLGIVLSATDALGRVIVLDYDEANRLTETSFPDGTTERRDYDAEGRVVSSTNRSGRVTTFLYDAVARILTTTFPDGSSTSSAYDDAGRLVASTDARGHTTSFVYDAAGRRTRIIDPLGNATAFEYDAAGNQISVTDALDHTTGFVYDDAGRLTITILPDGTSVATEYDELGRRIAELDQAGVRTGLGYDPLGRLVRVTDALGGITRYEYDEQGNRISQTDANGRITRFTFDAVGRQTSRILPDGASETFAYDEAGNRIQRIDFNGATASYAYDVNNRLIRRDGSDGTSASFTYTADGQRATVADARGVTSYEYDVRDRLVSMTAPEGWKLRYDWDAAGNRTAVTADLGAQGSHTTTYTYDAQNRLSSVTDSRGGVYGYAYDAAGRRVSLSYPNGAITSYSNDAVGRLVHLHTEAPDGTVIQDYAYTLGPTGNRLSVTEQDGAVRLWNYDELYRLVRERVSDGEGTLVYEDSFVYDAVGNRIQQTRTVSPGSAETIDYVYDSRDRVLTETSTSGANTTYGWDANGNLIRQESIEGLTVYDWDIESRLISVELPAGAVLSNTYDIDGILLGSVLNPGEPDGLPVARHFVNDSSGLLSSVVAEITATESVPIAYVRGEELLGFSSNGQARYTHTDHIGSIRAITESTSLVSESHDYEAFGEIAASSGASASPFLFAGERRDAVTSSYFLRARWYDPGLGSFMSPDPAGRAFADPTTFAPYSYASSDPVNRIDPSGLEGFLSLSIGSAVRTVMASVLVGAVTGGAFGAIFNTLAGESAREGALEGAKLGFALGPFSFIRYVRAALLGLGMGFSFVGSFQAALDENYALAALHGAMFVVGGFFAAVSARGLYGEFRMVNPQQLRWSQTSAGGRGRADILRLSMREHGWKGPPINAVETPKGLVTVDHTRAAVAIELGIDAIPVRIHKPSQPLPPELLSHTWNRNGQSALTWGQAVALRGAGQKPPLPPTGRSKPPRLPPPKVDLP